MKSPRMISVLIVLSLYVFANAQTVKVSEDSESLRQMLTHQPNFIATQQTFYWRDDDNNSRVVEGKKRRMVKLGHRLAEVTDDAIIIKERDKPIIKIFPQRREYSEVLFQDNSDIADLPEEDAARKGLVFKLLGREKVGTYDCIKIEASYPYEALKESKYLYWAAPELKGLVVKTETIYTHTRSQMLLQDISLTVDESIFIIPAGYKKVVEPEL